MKIEQAPLKIVHLSNQVWTNFHNSFFSIEVVWKSTWALETKKFSKFHLLSIIEYYWITWKDSPKTFRYQLEEKKSIVLIARAFDLTIVLWMACVLINYVNRRNAQQWFSGSTYRSAQILESVKKYLYAIKVSTRHLWYIFVTISWWQIL